MDINRAFEIARRLENEFRSTEGLSVITRMAGEYPDEFGADFKAACAICDEHSYHRHHNRHMYAYVDQFQEFWIDRCSEDDIKQRAQHGDRLAVEYLRYQKEGHPTDQFLKSLTDAAGEAHPGWYKAKVFQDIDRWEPADKNLYAN